jgi:oxygen-independent coproporphyrinogen III oxidase
MTLSLPVASQRVSEETPYVAYAYSYPHKSAYGPLDPPISLAPLWQAECRDALFLYLHVPFCEMRCGFCNLFARAGGNDAYLDAYLDALERQAAELAIATEGDRRIVRLAVGGGTPTFLSPRQLERLFDIAEHYFSASCDCIPTSVETSPKTATADRLACLSERGVQRISIGIQSFSDADNRSIGRPQSSREVHEALERARRFPTLNIDLIYGQPGQTVVRWLESLRLALRYDPQELFLYPLYVRPRTGIGRRGDVRRAPSEHMRQLYRAGRDLLEDVGYEQVSMRYFRKRTARATTGPIYCCQTDGMVGLGCGARSYSSGLHYSSPFAVEPLEVQAILDEWILQSRDDFSFAQWGCHLSEDDRQRRFLIQSLLTLPGLDASEFARLFNGTPAAAIPDLVPLIDEGFVENRSGLYRLTPLGMEFSDAIGPALYSPQHLARLESFAQW